MPTYRFLNTETNEEYEEFMSISQLEKTLKDNPHITQLVNGAPGIVSGSSMKPDAGFRDLLTEIKKSHSKGISKSTVNNF